MTKISEATPKILQNTDMLPAAKSGDTNAYHLTGMAITERCALVAPHSQPLWIPPTQPSALQTNGENFGYEIIPDAIGWNYAGFISLWEALRADHPSYITRTTPGKDASDTYDWYYYIFTPDSYEKTVIVNCSIHGGEITPSLAMYRFCHHLANDWTTYPELAYLRNKVRLIVVPIANPWGVSQSSRTRYNANHVDLNRNFDYKWTTGIDDPGSIYYRGSAAFSEPESRYIRDLVITTYSNATAFIDMHNLGSNFGNAFVHMAKKFDTDERPARMVMRFMAQDGTDSGIYYMDAGNTYCYMQSQRSIHALQPEYPDGHWGTTYDATEITAAVKWFGNLVLQYAALSAVPEIFLIDDPKLWRGVFWGDTIATNSVTYAELEDLKLTFNAPGRGILLVDGEITMKNDTAGAINYVMPVVIQTGSDFIVENSNRYESYSESGAARVTIPFSAASRVLMTNTKPGEDPSGVEVKVKVKVSTGTSVIHRYRVNVLWIPAEKADAVQLFDATAGTGMVKVYPS